MTGLLYAIVAESGAHVETAGSLNDGARVFVSMKLPDGIVVGGVDLVATNSGDRARHRLGRLHEAQA